MTVRPRAAADRPDVVLLRLGVGKAPVVELHRHVGPRPRSAAVPALRVLVHAIRCGGGGGRRPRPQRRGAAAAEEAQGRSAASRRSDRATPGGDAAGLVRVRAAQVLVAEAVAQVGVAGQRAALHVAPPQGRALPELVQLRRALHADHRLRAPDATLPLLDQRRIHDREQRAAGGIGGEAPAPPVLVCLPPQLDFQEARYGVSEVCYAPTREVLAVCQLLGIGLVVEDTDEDAVAPSCALPQLVDLPEGDHAPALAPDLLAPPLSVDAPLRDAEARELLDVLRGRLLGACLGGRSTHRARCTRRRAAAGRQLVAGARAVRARRHAGVRLRCWHLCGCAAFSGRLPSGGPVSRVPRHSCRPRRSIGSGVARRQRRGLAWSRGAPEARHLRKRRGDAASARGGGLSQQGGRGRPRRGRCGWQWARGRRGHVAGRRRRGRRGHGGERRRRGCCGHGGGRRWQGSQGQDGGRRRWERCRYYWSRMNAHIPWGVCFLLKEVLGLQRSVHLII
mmetsp:Transcript_7469/g.23591  ORF Transcript_7469/g.23591 Transcript_7469/m.23591 type:complete len:507 (+) Transcript_7469:1100-2620(+)